MSAKKEPGLSSDKSLEVTEKEHYAGLQQEFDREKENAKIIHQAKQEEKQHDMRNPEELAKATDENGNGMEQGSSVKTVENADGSISQVPIKDIVTIMESLADNSRNTRDLEVLTEYVRFAL